MTELAGSIIVVSHHRPQALMRCVLALRQQTYPRLELIVVADPAACVGLGGQDDIKIIPFADANISQARNLGLAQAAGDVVLFIDDDAVAEPNWAALLMAAFAAPQVVAATGFVRGRNGISYQWRAAMVDHLAQDHPLDVPPQPSLHQGCAQRAVKTQGTNCAFRRSALLDIGGFDAAFAFYLDEADVNLRLAARGGVTAIVPDAQVHHGFMASAQRTADRVPRTLFDIAASTAVFLRKHAGALDTGRDQLLAGQSARIAQLRARGKIGDHQAEALRQSLEDGWSAGMARPFGPPMPVPSPPAFRPLSGIGPRAAVVISGRFFAQKALHRAARAALADGKIVTVICLSPTPRRHKMAFLPQGYWWQSGGIWGRAMRDVRPRFWQGFAARIAEETRRLAPFRP